MAPGTNGAATVSGGALHELAPLGGATIGKVHGLYSACW